MTLAKYYFARRATFKKRAEKNTDNFESVKLFESPPKSLVNKSVGLRLAAARPEQIKVFPILERVYPHQKGRETNNPCH